MNYPLLLISRDEGLHSRVRLALPNTPGMELHCSPTYEPCPRPQGWLLILLDASAPAVIDAALDPAEVPPGDGAVLWLATPPLLAGMSAGAEATLWAWQPRILDYLDRTLAPSKLGFILEQHLAEAYLRCLRHLLPFVPGAQRASASEFQRQLNNRLTGILGNAELALENGRRLPTPVADRLRRISSLAGEMRDWVISYHQARSESDPPVAHAA